MVDKMKIALIVPAFNEEKNLSQLVPRFNNVCSLLESNNFAVEIVLINDGSNDNTEKVARQNGFTVISHPFNLGVCAALQTGFIYAQNKQHDCLITIDADGQHNPEDVLLLLKEFEIGKTDVVIGSRFLHQTNYKKNIPRYIGIKMFSAIVKLLTHKIINDVTSGFRIFNRKAISFLAKNFPTDYPDAEMLILLSKFGFSIKEVSLEMNPRLSGQSQHRFHKAIFYPFKNLVAICVVLIRSVLWNKKEANV